MGLQAALIFDWKYIYFCQKNAFHKVVSEIVLWPFQPRLKSLRKNNYLDQRENCEQWPSMH